MHWRFIVHSLIDRNMVEIIRNTGKAYESLPDRRDILEAHALPFDQPAENVVVTGCAVLPGLPDIIGSLSRVFSRKGLSHTFLSREYCCGNYLYRPAISARDDEAMEQIRGLSREFVAKNIEQARNLGARRLVIFCSPCYPIYRHAFPDDAIVFYPEAIGEVMGKLSFPRKVDYYAGCYKLHRKMSPVPMDLDSTDWVFSQIEGLEVNRIPAPQCCFKPEGLSQMIDPVRADLMVHICTGCYGQAVGNMPPDRKTEVLMLPQLVERAMGR
jgi:hypothetical protein